MKKTWNILYNHERLGTCLYIMFTGTREKAEEYAKSLGEGYWVEDGTATLEAFSHENS